MGQHHLPGVSIWAAPVSRAQSSSQEGPPDSTLWGRSSQDTSAPSATQKEWVSEARGPKGPPLHSAQRAPELEGAMTISGHTGPRAPGPGLSAATPRARPEVLNMRGKGKWQQDWGNPVRAKKASALEWIKVHTGVITCLLNSLVPSEGLFPITVTK